MGYKGRDDEEIASYGAVLQHSPASIQKKKPFPGRELAWQTKQGLGILLAREMLREMKICVVSTPNNLTLAGKLYAQYTSQRRTKKPVQLPYRAFSYLAFSFLIKPIFQTMSLIPRNRRDIDRAFQC